MEAIKLIAKYVDAWWAYLSWCLNAPISAPTCQPFWKWVAIAIIAIGLLILWKVLVKVVKYYLAVRAENKRLAEQQRVADEETMMRHKWDGDKAFPASETENVEDKIRQALTERKQAERSEQRRATHDKSGDDTPPIV